MSANVFAYAVIVQHEKCFNVMAVHQTLTGAKETLKILAESCKKLEWKDETRRYFVGDGYQYYIQPTVLWK